MSASLSFTGCSLRTRNSISLKCGGTVFRAPPPFLSKGLRPIRKTSLPIRAQEAAIADKVTPVDDETAMDCINTIRFLAVDGVNKANSGHPGLPMGAAPMGFVLYNEYLKYNPKNPKWFNRDRFVLSAGHGCMLQYSLMYLAGYDSVQIDDLKQFRQWGSCTPGHPENFETEGIEVTTGPLGQGICNAVGLALAEANLAARFNKPDLPPIVDHYTYCIVGDGCNMEGISNEACSLAGHWGLGKLICLYDDNKISIDGHTDIAFTEDVSARFESLGWHVLHVEDGNHDLNSLRAAIETAKSVKDKPTMIKVSTLIGYGSPNKANSHDAHGAPLGADETALTRENLKWSLSPFEVPDKALNVFRTAIERGAKHEKNWNQNMEKYQEKYPEEYAEFASIMTGKLPEKWSDALPSFTPEDKGLATRAHSQTMLNVLAPVLPGLIGGSADLAPSNLTLMKMFGDFQKDSPAERNVRFGVREHGMGAISNGIALHSPGFIPYCATFFIFTDYMRAAIRMSALSQAGVIYVMTHDSIGLGEDGPTHQPVEHLMSFRAMPNLLMMRPCGGNETAGCYKIGVNNRKRPTVIALSRQGMPNLAGTDAKQVTKGAYVVSDSSEAPQVIIMGTGSELHTASQAVDVLKKEGVQVRLVSMVCWELFEEQDEEYKNSVLPSSVTARVAVEAGAKLGWEKYLGLKGEFVGVGDRFGASAPGPTLYKEYGITPEAVCAAAKKSMSA
eukprot:g3606.t1